MSYGILGPAGTFSEAAAACYWPQATVFETANSITELFCLLERGTVSDILIPFENSSAGIIRNSLEGLTLYPVMIKGELIIPVEQCLMAADNYSPAEIELVVTQPAALVQCETYLKAALPGARIEITDSTARAAQMVAAEPRKAAAVGHSRAADNYGLTIIARGIQQENNHTRFLHLTHNHRGEPGNGDKCSIIFELGNQPGALYEALGVMTRRNLNLSKIESYPVQTKGRYRFYVEVDILDQIKTINQLLRELESSCTMVTYLGSYNRHREEIIC